MNILQSPNTGPGGKDFGGKDKHRCFDHYRTIGNRRLICDVCGKITKLTNSRKKR